ncbi:MAG: glycosyltransferase [Rickettsiales bacterium]|jgi:glycosyltransferase involved in cell wall biosynthesis|nr:glycosyltransferase [Rickettsiales bacterium]
MPKVSIIIPNYNNARYLPDCLASVLAQTLRDIEVLVVDDCSTDNSINVLESFAATDNRIRIIKMPQNGGVGRARNAGLDAAIGDFIMFLDSDDCLYSNAAESLLSAAESNGADLAVGRYSFVDDDFTWNASVANGSVGGHAFEVSRDITKFVRIIDFGVAPVVCWGKLFRRRILGDMRFNDIYPNEDVDFMMRSYSKFIGKTCVMVEMPAVFYRRSASSIIKDGINPRFVEGWRQAILSAHKYLVGATPPLLGGGTNPSPDDFILYRAFFGRYCFIMLQSMMIDPLHNIDDCLNKAIRDIWMAGVFVVAGIDGRARFGLKLYVSGLRWLSRKFLIYNLPAIGKL